MAALGHPVPQRMTGTVPSGLLEAPVERADYGEVPFGSDRTVADARDDVTDALSDLGYI
ncbi:hypothetical protein ACFQER_05465 [Halomicroarcula sp. GCM10025894]